MIRLKYLSSFTNDYEVTYDNVDILTGSICEVDITLICACLPALRPLIMISIPKLHRNYVSKGGTAASGTARSGMARSGTANPGRKVRRWKKSFGSSLSTTTGGTDTFGTGHSESYVGLESRGCDSVEVHPGNEVEVMPRAKVKVDGFEVAERMV